MKRLNNCAEQITRFFRQAVRDMIRRSQIENKVFVSQRFNWRFSGRFSHLERAFIGQNDFLKSVDPDLMLKKVVSILKSIQVLLRMRACSNVIGFHKNVRFSKIAYIVNNSLFVFNIYILLYGELMKLRIEKMYRIFRIF